MHLKLSSATWRAHRFGFNVLTEALPVLSFAVVLQTVSLDNTALYNEYIFTPCTAIPAIDMVYQWQQHISTSSGREPIRVNLEQYHLK